MTIIILLCLAYSMNGAEEQHNKDYQKHVITRSKRKRDMLEVEVEEASVVKRQSLGSSDEGKVAEDSVEQDLDKIDFEAIKPPPIAPLSFWEKVKIYCSCGGRRK